MSDNQATEPATSALDPNQAGSLFAELLSPTVEEDKKPAQEVEPVAEVEASEPEMVEVDIDGFKVSLPKEKAEKLEA